MVVLCMSQLQYFAIMLMKFQLYKMFSYFILVIRNNRRFDFVVVSCSITIASAVFVSQLSLIGLLKNPKMTTFENEK